MRQPALAKIKGWDKLYIEKSINSRPIIVKILFAILSIQKHFQLERTNLQILPMGSINTRCIEMVAKEAL